MTNFDPNAHLADIRWPFMLPANPVKRALVLHLGRAACVLAPQRANTLLTHGDPSDFTGLDKLMLYGHLHRAQRSGDFAPLAGVQARFWAGKGGATFNTSAEVAARFERWFLGAQSGIGQAISTELGRGEGLHAMVELGCGNGLLLEHLSRLLPCVPECVGVDVNATAIAANGARWSDPRLHWEATSLQDYAARPAAGPTLWISNGGVLEYLPEAELRALLTAIVARPGRRWLALVEPLSDTHALDQTPHSLPKAGEFTFSHNHPALLKSEGWDVLWREEQNFEDMRWLLLLATHPA